MASRARPLGPASQSAWPEVLLGAASSVHPSPIFLRPAPSVSRLGRSGCRGSGARPHPPELPAQQSLGSDSALCWGLAGDREAAPRAGVSLWQEVRDVALLSALTRAASTPCTPQAGGRPGLCLTFSEVTSATSPAPHITLKFGVRMGGPPRSRALPAPHPRPAGPPLRPAPGDPAPHTRLVEPGVQGRARQEAQAPSAHRAGPLLLLALELSSAGSQQTVLLCPKVPRPSQATSPERRGFGGQSRVQPQKWPWTS